MGKQRLKPLTHAPPPPNNIPARACLHAEHGLPPNGHRLSRLGRQAGGALPPLLRHLRLCPRKLLQPLAQDGSVVGPGGRHDEAVDDGHQGRHLGTGGGEQGRRTFVLCTALEASALNTGEGRAGRHVSGAALTSWTGSRPSQVSM